MKHPRTIVQCHNAKLSHVILVVVVDVTSTGKALILPAWLHDPVSKNVLSIWLIHIRKFTQEHQQCDGHCEPRVPGRTGLLWSHYYARKYGLDVKPTKQTEWFGLRSWSGLWDGRGRGRECRLMKGNIRCEHCAWMSYRVLILPGSFTEVHITSGFSDRSHWALHEGFSSLASKSGLWRLRSYDNTSTYFSIPPRYSPEPMSVNKFEECMTSSSQTLNAVVCPGWTRAKIDKWKTSGMELHVMYSRGRQLPSPYRLDASSWIRRTAAYVPWYRQLA